MQPTDEASTKHDCTDGVILSRLLNTDDVDAALDAGLMAFAPCPSCDAKSTAHVYESQRRLATAWAARDRYLARSARLARLARELDARRTGMKIEKKTSLPPSVAAILARAKAKAAERGPG